MVEVGPGLGSLTLALCEAGAHVRAVELDHRLADVLATVVEGKPVDIVQADALTVDWPELLADHDRWIMVSNLPYNVATPVVVRALETAPIDRPLPRDGAARGGERLAAVPGTKAYGALSVKVAYYAQADVVGTVPPDGVRARSPRSTARSCGCTRHAAPPVVRPRSGALVRARARRLRDPAQDAARALDDPSSADRAEHVFAGAGIDPSARAETLTLSQWAALAHTEATGFGAGGRVDAFAKLTLSLHVTGTRADGYHDLDMLVVPVSEPHDELVIRPATTYVDRGDGPVRRGGADRRHEPGGACRARARREREPSSCTRASRPAPGSAAGRPTPRPCSRVRGAVAGIATALTSKSSASRRRSAPTCRSACAAAARCACAGIGDDLEPVKLPDLAVVIATPPFGARPPTCTARGTRSADPSATRSRSTASRRSATTSSPPRTTWSRGSSRSKAAVERAAGAPALLAGSGSSYAVVFHRPADAEAARARVAGRRPKVRSWSGAP